MEQHLSNRIDNLRSMVANHEECMRLFARTSRLIHKVQIRIQHRKDVNCTFRDKDYIVEQPIPNYVDAKRVQKSVYKSDDDDDLSSVSMNTDYMCSATLASLSSRGRTSVDLHKHQNKGIVTSSVTKSSHRSVARGAYSRLLSQSERSNPHIAYMRSSKEYDILFPQSQTFLKNFGIQKVNENSSSSEDENEAVELSHTFYGENNNASTFSDEGNTQSGSSALIGRRSMRSLSKKIIPERRLTHSLNTNGSSSTSPSKKLSKSKQQLCDRMLRVVNSVDSSAGNSVSVSVRTCETSDSRAWSKRQQILRLRTKRLSPYDNSSMQEVSKGKHQHHNRAIPSISSESTGIASNISEIGWQVYD